jgi:hypothetical protein
MDDRRLARAVRTEEAEDFSRSDIETDVADGRERIEELGDAASGLRLEAEDIIRRG